jgi:hypothetical protein
MYIYHTATQLASLRFHQWYRSVCDSPLQANQQRQDLVHSQEQTEELQSVVNAAEHPAEKKAQGKVKESGANAVEVEEKKEEVEEKKEVQKQPLPPSKAPKATKQKPAAEAHPAPTQETVCVTARAAEDVSCHTKQKQPYSAAFVLYSADCAYVL